jgi:hypothetical protein
LVYGRRVPRDARQMIVATRTILRFPSLPIQQRNG